MRSKLIAVLTALLLLGSSCSDNQKQTTEEEKIKAIVVDMWDAIENEDIERYASYIHPDYTSFGETEKSLSVGKETEVRTVKEWTSKAKMALYPFSFYSFA